MKRFARKLSQQTLCQHVCIPDLSPVTPFRARSTACSIIQNGSRSVSVVVVAGATINAAFNIDRSRRHPNFVYTVGGRSDDSEQRPRHATSFIRRSPLSTAIWPSPHMYPSTPPAHSTDPIQAAPQTQQQTHFKHKDSGPTPDLRVSDAVTRCLPEMAIRLPSSVFPALTESILLLRPLKRVTFTRPARHGHGQARRSQLRAHEDTWFLWQASLGGTPLSKASDSA